MGRVGLAMRWCGYLWLLLPVVAVAQPGDPPSARRLGHSKHGTSFDEGPRQKPTRLEGIGKSHFPITTTVPEVQEWFDQGHTLLRHYDYHEAERAFRWCLKLDPGCAMAYWGLARVATDADEQPTRARDFLAKAEALRSTLTVRERMYLDAWRETQLAEFDSESVEEKETERNHRRTRVLCRALERIVVAYPDDVEAKALLAEAAISPVGRSVPYAGELLIQQILAVQPDHPGAHHYRIHMWDAGDLTMALPSAEAYPRVAPNAGHALHVPGHTYAGLGMWNEAAILMDQATRLTP